ncbi:MAG: ERF family protein [Ignavibacteriaceae bacterium]
MTHPLTKMLDASYVQHDAENKAVGYKYVSAAAVSKKLTAALSEVGLHIKSVEMGFVANDGKVFTEIVGPEGDRLLLVVVKVRVMLSDGETEYGPYEGLGSGADTGDKSIMKAETAAFKYALSRVSGMAWGDDPEADAKTDLLTGPKREPKKKKANTKQAFAASVTKKAIENAACIGMEAMRAAWEAADKADLQLIVDEYPDWQNEQKGLAKNADTLKKSENTAEISAPG